MTGVSAIALRESLDEWGERLRQVEQPIFKERLQVLYWLKQAQAPSVSQIAVVIDRLKRRKLFNHFISPQILRSRFVVCLCKIITGWQNPGFCSPMNGLNY